MGILSKLTDEIKNAMRAKDSLRLDALRAIKSGILLSQTAGTGTKELNDDESIRLLQRLVKQRKESAAIYREQDRADLAEPEEAQAERESTEDTKWKRLKKGTSIEDIISFSDLGKMVSGLIYGVTQKIFAQGAAPAAGGGMAMAANRASLDVRIKVLPHDAARQCHLSYCDSGPLQTRHRASSRPGFLDQGAFE